MSQIDLVLRASVSTPAINETTVYVDSVTKKLKSKDDAGVVTDYAASSNGITQITGEVLAGPGPGSVAATVTNLAVLSKVLTGLTPSTADLLATDSIIQAFGKIASKMKNQDWIPTLTPDGDVVITSDTTLTKDMYYNTLVINSGATLFTNGYRVLAKVSIENNGTINREGLNSPGLTGAAGLAVGTIGGSAAGGNGGTTTGVIGTAAANALGGNGGAGGAGTSGAGGGSGVATQVATNSGGIDVLNTCRQASVCRDLTGAVIQGAAGGGGGGGDGVSGGGGGGGGGVMCLVTRTLFGTGVITVKGGNGGSPVAGNRGGGAGGGGGVIALLTENDTQATSLTFNVSGGLGNSGTGTGVAGANGANGRIYRVRF